jgi:hypothetical protein
MSVSDSTRRIAVIYYNICHQQTTVVRAALKRAVSTGNSDFAGSHLS